MHWQDKRPLVSYLTRSEDIQPIIQPIREMKKIRAAVVGYGNIGHYSVQALEAAPDFEIAGIVRRQGDKDKPAELAAYDVVDDIEYGAADSVGEDVEFAAVSGGEFDPDRAQVSIVGEHLYDTRDADLVETHCTCDRAAKNEIADRECSEGRGVIADPGLAHVDRPASARGGANGVDHRAGDSVPPRFG